MSKKLYEYLERSEIASKIYILMLSKEMSIKRLSIAIYGNPNQKKNIYKYIQLFKGKYIEGKRPTIDKLRERNASREIFYSANFEPMIEFTTDNLGYKLSKKQISILREIMEENRYRIEESGEFISQSISVQNKDFNRMDWNALKYLVSYCQLIIGLIQTIKADINKYDKVNLGDEREKKLYEKYKKVDLEFISDIINLFYRMPYYRVEEFAEITFNSEYLENSGPFFDFTDPLPAR